MASEWLPALFGVIGTLLGGAVTLTANWISSRTQRYLAIEDHNQQNAAIRREAYAPFLASAAMLKDRGRELAESIRAEIPDEDKIESLRKVYYESWEDMKGKRPLALIVGPSDSGMPDIVNNLHGALIAFADHCDAIYRDRPTRRSPKYDQLAADVDDAFAKCAEAARKFAIVNEPDLTTDRKIWFFKKSVSPPTDKVNPDPLQDKKNQGSSNLYMRSRIWAFM